MSSEAVSKTRELDRLEARYRARKLAIRADATLSWEKKELAVKALTDTYYQARAEIEKEDA